MSAIHNTSILLVFNTSLYRYKKIGFNPYLIHIKSILNTSTTSRVFASTFRLLKKKNPKKQKKNQNPTIKQVDLDDFLGSHCHQGKYPLQRVRYSSSKYNTWQRGCDARSGSFTVNQNQTNHDDSMATKRWRIQII